MRRLVAALFICTTVATTDAQAPRAQRITLPESQQFTNADRQVVAMSPDGTRFAYVANTRLYLMAIGDAQPLEVPGTTVTQGISNPVFSSDGRSIVFWSGADRTLKRIAVTGGTATTICEADNPLGMSRGPNDTLIVGQGLKGIMRVSANGGKPETLITMKGTEIAYGPQLLPGGDAMLFTVIDAQTALTASWDKARIVVQPLGGGERKMILEVGRDGRYTSSGHLLYADNGRLLAVPFDPKRRETIGKAMTVLEDIRTAGPTGAAQFSVSDSGSLVYLPERSGETELALVGLDGTRKTLGALPNAAASPRISSDGKQVTFASEGNIWTAELLNLSGMRKIISGSNYNFPVFSDDGKWIVLGTILPDGLETVYMQRSDGSGEMELLARPARAPEQWIPGTQTFSYISHKGRLDYDIWTYTVPNHEVTPLARIPVSAQLSSRFSPDGHWVAYMSNETGEYQVYLEPWPQTGARFQVTKQGGRMPMWSADSTDIYYEYNARVYAVAFQNGLQMFGQPRELPISGFVQPALRRNFDQTPNGRQFLMVFHSAPRVGIVSKWLEAAKTSARSN